MSQPFTTGAAILLLAAMQPQAVFAQPPAGRERVIAEQPGVPLASRLLPNDDVVIVKPESHGPEPHGPEPHGAVFMDNPTAAQMLQYYIDTSDVSLVVDVTNVSGVLSEDQSSISTRIDGTVIDAVLVRKGSVRPGQPLQIAYAAGGELAIGKVLVKFGNRLNAGPLSVVSTRREGWPLVSNGRATSRARWSNLQLVCGWGHGHCASARPAAR
jgi:hypothetical protein